MDLLDKLELIDKKIKESLIFIILIKEILHKRRHMIKKNYIVNSLKMENINPDVNIVLASNLKHVVFFLELKKN